MATHKHIGFFFSEKSDLQSDFLPRETVIGTVTEGLRREIPLPLPAKIFSDRNGLQRCSDWIDEPNIWRGDVFPGLLALRDRWYASVR